jgi:hypothetical protein
MMCVLRFVLLKYSFQLWRTKDFVIRVSHAVLALNIEGAAFMCSSAAIWICAAC